MWAVRVADGDNSHAFPLFIEIIAVVGGAVVQAKTIELGVVVDIEKFQIGYWLDSAVENPQRGDGCRRLS